MIRKIYENALAAVMKKPFRLWGISLLSGFLSFVGFMLFGVIPGVALSISILLSTSMTMLFLHGYRGEEVQVSRLFECFRDWKTVKRVLCGTGWSWLWIFLWFLIPFVGPIFAVIRAYRFRLVPYILVTEPEIGILDAVKVSTERTKGWKSKMFLSELLFVLAVLVVNLVLALLAMIPYLGVLFGIVNIIFTVAVTLFGVLFLGFVKAAFYEEIRNSVTVCPDCGGRIAPGVAFCPNCGRKL